MKPWRSAVWHLRLTWPAKSWRSTINAPPHTPASFSGPAKFYIFCETNPKFPGFCSVSLKNQLVPSCDSAIFFETKPNSDLPFCPIFFCAVLTTVTREQITRRVIHGANSTAK
jgi:hypothetical protein